MIWSGCIIWTKFRGNGGTGIRFWPVLWPVSAERLTRVLLHLLFSRGTHVTKIFLQHLLSEHESKMNCRFSQMTFTAKHYQNRL